MSTTEIARDVDEAVNVNAALVARLRQLADVLEREDMPDLRGYASLTSDGPIGILESPFKDMFSGQLVRGRRGGRLLAASAEAYGITFDSLLYDSDDGRVRDVTIQL